jgi:hypothetical protein
MDDLGGPGGGDDRVEHRAVWEVSREDVGVDGERVGLGCREKDREQKKNQETHRTPVAAPL